MHASPFVAWESFYVIVGSSAGGLTGLQFVVMALIAEQGMQGSGRQISAFGTPTVVHFSAVLLLAAILSSPWHGLSGAVRQDAYKPVAEDWVWHAVLPCAAYVAILAGSIQLKHDPSTAMFAVGAAALLLLFIGIHNAWDTVTYIVVGQSKARKEPEVRKEGAVHDA